ncbi:Y-family DNA polymerase [Paraherbaspirillum soli]|uniref:Y-family DNA polymerase n=1 Tax=Paraherbaspirillum soli TaxID=631222 RepID=A0ABW0M607_9BURK
MRFWISVHLPLLALETLRPRWSEPGPHVVLEREQVLAVSADAAAYGVHLGMRRGGVAAIAPAAVLHERDAVREQQALDSIALALLQYTPEVAHAEESSFVLDVSASLRAFGGRLALLHLVRATVGALGFTVRIGSAPTAQGACMLAHYAGTRQTSKCRRSIKLGTMTRRIDRLPFEVLPAARPYRDLLDGIGCRSIGDLRQLPRAGLQRRTDQSVLNAIDRAYGQATELFDWVQAPLTFSAKLELPDRVEHAEALLFAARRLILQMTGWLVSRQLAVSRYVLLLEHERGRQAIAPTAVEIMLAEPAWHEEHLLRLLKERLGRVELSAPVIGLRLEAVQVTTMLPPTATLFPEPGSSSADFHRLLELLTARLGRDNVLLPAPVADHRPERCNAWAPAGTAKKASAQVPFPLPAGIARPFWLLEQPIALPLREHRPFYGSQLRLISGPERIEAGWWDGALAVRDYFVAQGDENACYWIYRERADQDARWYLHGLFA